VLLPLAASVLLVLGSPYVGQIRGALQSTFPDRYRWIIGGIVLMATVAAIALALERLRRSQRDARASGGSDGPPPWLRYGLVVSAVTASAAYAAAVRSGTPDVDLVEAFHFVEYGALSFLFYRAWRGRQDMSRLVFTACAALAVGLADESVQWFVPGRVGEIHDVWLNGAAVGCGLLLSVAVDPPLSWRLPLQPRSRLALGVATSGVLVAIAGFVDRIHIGYEVRDAQVGTFRSTFDARALEAAARDRVRRWAASPPPLEGFAREDHYFSEGLWHVQRRNLDVTAGDWSGAWHENAILERFYAPVLERGSRWSAGQRADMQRSAGAAVGSVYVSDAAPYPIYVIRRPAFWGAVVLLGGAIVWCCRVRREPSPSPV
jgi:VanZ family protein